MISQDTISQVFETARVEEVIGEFVQLKKSGSNFKGLSPFSDERTPSFMVSPVKQIWKDFSSGKGGSVVSFLMEHEHFSYPEAIRYLAKKYNIAIEETVQTDEQREQTDRRESMYLVSDYAKDWFKTQMWETDLGRSIGLSYFKERGFSEETIKKFELGYSPDQWSAFTDDAIRNGYQEEFLEATGLTIIKEDKKFDRFKGRVMFPIKSMAGRCLGFGGRILGTNAKAAKYLNSPESEIYHKSKVLYGIYYAKQAIAKEDICYLVEGYTDVIQMSQSGIENVVSSSGTALTADQIRLINRLTKNITVLFDGDAAGLRAAIRGIDLILEQGMNVRVCTFPDGEDPDSFSRKHTTEDIKKYLNENSRDFIAFKANLLATEAAGDTIKRAEIIREIVGSISKVPDAISREVFIKETANQLDMGEDVLFSTLNQIIAATNRNLKKQDAQQKKPQPMAVVDRREEVKIDEQRELERSVIEALVLYGQSDETFMDVHYKLEDDKIVEEEVKINCKVYEKIYRDLQQDEIEFSNPEFQSLYNIIIPKLAEDAKFEPAKLLPEVEPDQQSLITDVIMKDSRYSLSRWDSLSIPVKSKETGIPQFVSEIILNLRRLLIAKKLDAITDQLKVEGDHTEILTEIMDYTGLRIKLYDKLRRII